MDNQCPNMKVFVRTLADTVYEIEVDPAQGEQGVRRALETQHTIQRARRILQEAQLLIDKAVQAEIDRQNVA